MLQDCNTLHNLATILMLAYSRTVYESALVHRSTS